MTSNAATRVSRGLLPSVWPGTHPFPQTRSRSRVEKGWVTLNGEVDWYFQKEAAARAVQTLIGVVGVSNQIEIKPTVNADDVGQNITRALNRSWFYDPNTIKVSAHGGKIKLTGQVTTWNARDLAGGYRVVGAGRDIRRE